MTSMEQALTDLMAECQEIQEMIIEAEDPTAIALVLLNQFTINTMSMLVLGGLVETHGDDNMREISNKIGEVHEKAVEELNQRVNTFAFLAEVPAARDLFEQLEGFEFEDDANG